MRTSALHTSLEANGMRDSNLVTDRTLQATQLLREALALLGSETTLAASVVKRNPDRLLRLPEVQRLTGLRRSAIYEHMQQGIFPRSVKVGPRAATWSEAAIQAWIADRLDGRPI
jgi:prophage regulatory protein